MPYPRQQCASSICPCVRCAGEYRYLLHGTSQSEPLMIATDSDGFMVDFGNPRAFYGKGCYFARRASDAGIAAE